MCYIGRLKNYIMKVEIDNHVKTFRFPSEDLIYFSQSYKISNYTKNVELKKKNTIVKK